jgi:hypothetical protein
VNGTGITNNNRAAIQRTFFTLYLASDQRWLPIRRGEIASSAARFMSIAQAHPKRA